jgi:integrase
MRRNPLYFFKSKYGVYLFRYSFPMFIYQRYNIQREIKISLRTKNRTVAIRRHLIVLLQVQTMTEKLNQKIMSNPKMDIGSVKAVINAYKKKIVVDDVRYENEDLKFENLALLVENAQHKQELTNKDNTINKLSSVSAPRPKAVMTISLANAMHEYFMYQVERQVWGDKVKRQRKGYMLTFADIIGQYEDISILDKDAITMYQRTLRCLPKNVNKFHKRPDDITQRPNYYKEIADSNTQDKLAARGVESHFNTVKPFLTWCVEMGYLAKDHRHILSIGKREVLKTKTEVLPFSPAHLVSMFTSYLYSDHLIPREKPCPMHFWMPILGLYTGARESELATLRLSDITRYHDILCFDINDDHDSKSVKTEASKRCVPIAQAILNAGFLVYVEQLKKETTEKDPPLFALPQHRDGVARAVSKWFNDNFKKKCKLTSPRQTKVCFHSFRHTMINKLSSTKIGDNIVENRIIKEIVGHEKGDVTGDVYGHNHDFALLKQVIDSLDFGIVASELTYERFLARRKYNKSNE